MTAPPKDPIVIAGAKRTPMGGLLGELSSLSAAELGSAAIRAAIGQAGIAPETIDEVIMGNVLGAGQGQAPARQASLGAGLAQAAGCTTVNKMCGSGMKAAMLAHDLLLAGNGRIMVAGGMESMSNAPYLLPRARAGQRLGHGQMIDHMFLDGLEDAYARGTLMGAFAEDCASRYQFTRSAQDEFAIASLTRARAANENGSFALELAPVAVKTRAGETIIARDEQPFKADATKIPKLKPAFRDGGTVTAANSSSISDGAAALVLMRRSVAEKEGVLPIATILAHATHAQEPAWFTTAPIGAIGKLLRYLDSRADDFDLYEINEAFAVVAMVAMRELGLGHERVNVHGGACALGHPIGASGARILATLIGALRRQGARRGIAALCIGGGEATAMAIELA